MSDDKKEDNIQTDLAEEDFGEQLQESLSNLKTYNIGDKVVGKIIEISDSYIFISLGGKQDAYAEKSDFVNKKGELPYKVDDKLTGYIVKYTDTEIVIARSIASANRKILREAFAEKIPVVGIVTSPVKGGYSVSISGIRAFCPISQMDLKIVRDPKIYAGQSFDFLITELSDDNRNIVVSRRRLLSKEMEENKQKILASLHIGDIVKGKITRLTNFGAFVDIGGIDGLLHVSEMSWAHVESPSDLVNIGDEIETKIIKMAKDKISLSRRALEEDPFDKIVEDKKVGDIVTCRVLRNLNFGSFVEIQKGVEALIPISEMALGRRINHPNEVLKPGDVVEAQIMKINAPDKKISLSLKALQKDPWDNINDFIDEGEVVTGIIENITNFGIFIRIQDGITGLLPKSKIKYLKEEISKENVGEELKVRVIQIEENKKRISLEPTDIPETAGDSRNDWKKYKKQKPKGHSVDPDNPFLKL